MGKLWKGLMPLALVGVFLFACGEETSTSPPPLSSPTETLRQFVYAFNHYTQHDAIKLLADTLAENFVLYLNPEDVGEEADDYIIPIPVVMTREEFLYTCLNLFNKAHSIDLEIPRLDEGLGDPGEDVGEYSVSNLVVNFIVMLSDAEGYQTMGVIDITFRLEEGSRWRILGIYDKDGVFGWVLGFFA